MNWKLVQKRWSIVAVWTFAHTSLLWQVLVNYDKNWAHFHKVQLNSIYWILSFLCTAKLDGADAYLCIDLLLSLQL